MEEICWKDLKSLDITVLMYERNHDEGTTGIRWSVAVSASIEMIKLRFHHH